MIISPTSSVASHLINLDRNLGCIKLVDVFARDIRNEKRRTIRHQFYEMKKLGYQTDPLVKANLVTVACQTDSDYTRMDVIFTLTGVGAKAVDTIRNGLVFDTKLQQATFSATSEFYLESLRANVVPNWIFTLAQGLPARYKEVHKALLLLLLFYEQDKTGNWIKVDLS